MEKETTKIMCMALIIVQLEETLEKKKTVKYNSKVRKNGVPSS